MPSLTPDARPPTPAVILVRPQLPENIGAAARAMANFGLSELRLVAPREGWPQKRARETASGGEAIIDAARTYPDFPSAIADLHLAYAATARPRDIEKRVITPQEAMGEIVRCGDVAMWRGGDKADSSPHLQRIALVFGPERTGLENEEIVLCDTLITIPTTPDHSSLNLAQSVVVLAYEWFCHPVGGEAAAQDPAKDPVPRLRLAQDDTATKADYQGLFDQLDAYLDATNYYRVAGKKTIMWQNLRNMLLRCQWSSQEIRSFRGMLRAIWERREKNEVS